MTGAPTLLAEPPLGGSEHGAPSTTSRGTEISRAGTPSTRQRRVRWSRRWCRRDRTRAHVRRAHPGGGQGGAPLYGRRRAPRPGRPPRGPPRPVPRLLRRTVPVRPVRAPSGRGRPRRRASGRSSAPARLRPDSRQRRTAVSLEGFVMRPLVERFWSKVRKSDGCWEWTAARRGPGYGVIGRGGRADGVAPAHVVSWEIHFGAVPIGLFVLHHCDNPPCVRPDHLHLGTKGDNTREMIERDRQPSQMRPARYCRRGHDLDAPGAVKFIGKSQMRRCVVCFRVADREFKRARRARLRGVA